MMTKTLCRAAMLAVMLLSFARAAFGEDLDINPMNWDFGDTLVGSQVTKTFDLASVGPSPVWVYYVALSPVATENPAMIFPTPLAGLPLGYALGSFSFDPEPGLWGPSGALALPVELPVGQHLMIDLTFAPETVGTVTAYFSVFSNDSVGAPGTQAFLLLQGHGVLDVSEPSPNPLAALGLAVVFWMRRWHAPRPPSNRLRISACDMSPQAPSFPRANVAI